MKPSLCEPGKRIEDCLGMTTLRVVIASFALFHGLSMAVLAQTPATIQNQPIQLDLSPYRQNQMQQMQMMERAVEQRNAREANSRMETKERYRAEIEQIKNYYDAFPTYPETVEDGWHEVVVI